MHIYFHCFSYLPRCNNNFKSKYGVCCYAHIVEVHLKIKYQNKMISEH